MQTVTKLRLSAIIAGLRARAARHEIIALSDIRASLDAAGITYSRKLARSILSEVLEH